MVVDTATWDDSATAATEVTIDIPGTYRGRMLFVFVRNPSTVTALTGKLQHRWIDDDTVRYADLSDASGDAEFTVDENNGDGQVFIIDGGLTAAGGRLVLSNNTVLGGSDGFDATVQVQAPLGN